jgi:hypothetical protein
MTTFVPTASNRSLEALIVMDRKIDSAHSGTHFSDIWTSAHQSRTAIVQLYLRKAWRHLRQIGHDDGIATSIVLRQADDRA